MQNADDNRLYGLQVLRFFAAFAVLFGHVQHEALSFGIAGDAALQSFEPFNFGSGVDVFFVISGFIMYHISAKTFGVTGAQKRFLIKRFIRLVPLYWFFTSAMLLAMAVVPGQLAHTTFNPLHIIASYFFVPWLDATGLPHPILGLGWTLNYEMFFYFVFSLALLLPRRIGLAALVCVFVLFAAINPLIDPEFVQLKFWTDPIIIEFLFGIGIAYLMATGVKIPGWAATALLLVGLAGLIASPFVSLGGGAARPIVVGIPAAMVVTGTAFGRFNAMTPLGKFLVLGGDASYALYLSHPFSINVVVLFWERLKLGGPWGYIIAAVMGAIVAAIVVHLVLERPLTKRLNATANARRPSALGPLSQRPAVNAGD